MFKIELYQIVRDVCYQTILAPGASRGWETNHTNGLYFSFFLKVACFRKDSGNPSPAEIEFHVLATAREQLFVSTSNRSARVGDGFPELTSHLNLSNHSTWSHTLCQEVNRVHLALCNAVLSRSSNPDLVPADLDVTCNPIYPGRLWTPVEVEYQTRPGIEGKLRLVSLTPTKGLIQ